MLNIQEISIKGSTQSHLPFENIRDDLLILKDGSCAMILEVSSVNFDLLSEKEQEAMIYAYQGLINSLSFPIQILIRSSLKDITNYLKRLEARETQIVNPLLKKQINGYRQFVKEVVKQNNVLSKNFYVIIPFSVFELGLVSVRSAIPGTKRIKSALPLPAEEILAKAKISLEPKKQQLIDLFGHLGLSARQLTTREIIKLFFQIYNGVSSFAYNFNGALPDLETNG